MPACDELRSDLERQSRAGTQSAGAESAERAELISVCGRAHRASGVGLPSAWLNLLPRKAWNSGEVAVARSNSACPSDGCGSSSLSGFWVASIIVAADRSRCCSVRAASRNAALLGAANNDRVRGKRVLLKDVKIRRKAKRAGRPGRAGRSNTRAPEAEVGF